MVGPDNRTQPPLSGCTQNTKKTIGGKARSSSSSLCVCFQISLMTARMPSISGLTQNKKENHPRVFSLSDSLLLCAERRRRGAIKGYMRRECHCQGFLILQQPQNWNFFIVRSYQAARSRHGNALFPINSFTYPQHSHFDHL